MFSFLHKRISSKVYFSIWFFNIIFFIVITVLFNKLAVFFQQNPILFSIFAPIYLTNIFVGIIAFFIGLVSLFSKKEVGLSSQTQRNIQSPKKKFLFSFWIIFFLLISFLMLSNVPFFTNDPAQFLRLVIMSFLAFLSIFSFILYLSTYPYKIIPKNELKEERHTFSYWVGSLVISSILALLISILFGFISIPFMQIAENLTDIEKARIGVINLWRFDIIFGFFTVFVALICFQKKIYRLLAGLLIFFFIFGTVIVVFINSSSYKSLFNPNVNSESGNFFSKRDLCNKEQTLRMAKGCILRILRDDGGHGTGFVINSGFLITNKHVIEGAKKLTVYIYGEKEVNVWNYSPNLDLAILKLPDDSLISSCVWFDSKKLNIAEELYTFGWPNNPTGDSTVTRGIYSRTNNYEDGSEDIQTDASINPGNSGGPLINECGVVGINTARADWSQEQAPRVIEGMSFALSSSFIHSKIDELIKTGKIAKGIPGKTRYQVTDNFPSNPSQNFSLNIEDIKTYLNDIYRTKSSWEQARGHVNSEKLDKLIDSFNRQIEFCNHLINKLSGGQPASGDDVNLWSAVVKMSNESAALTNELNGR